MMKKRLMVLCALLLAMLMLGAAGADEAGAWVSKYPKAPESRLTYKVPDGVKADVEKSNVSQRRLFIMKNRHETAHLLLPMGSSWLPSIGYSP